MSRTISSAVIQMQAAPSARHERLALAAERIGQAATAGAQLIVLPAYFNTGFSYDEALYERAESMEDVTVSWLKEQAAHNQAHIAGTLMIRELNEVYETAILAAPDGRIWRADCQYPLLWERSLIRNGERTTVAHTDLGLIGLMVGWDAAQSELWTAFGARVDLVLWFGALPDFSGAEVLIGTGIHTLKELGGVASWIARDAVLMPSELAAWTRWLGVPLIASAATGQVDSVLPMPLFSFGALLDQRDWLKFKLMANAGDARLRFSFSALTNILDGAGRPFGQTEGDVLRADVPLADEPPIPPPTVPGLTRTRLGRDLLTAISDAMMIPVYRRGLRRTWGGRMAPMAPRTRIWMGFLLALGLLTWMIGRSQTKEQHKLSRKLQKKEKALKQARREIAKKVQKPVEKKPAQKK